MFHILLWLPGSSKADLWLNYNYLLEIMFMPNYYIFVTHVTFLSLFSDSD